MFTEMVSIIKLAQLVKTLIVCHAQSFGKSLNVGFHLRCQFCQTDTANGGVLYILMLSRLFSSLKILSCENFVIHVMKTNSK